MNTMSRRTSFWAVIALFGFPLCLIAATQREAMLPGRQVQPEEWIADLNRAAGDYPDDAVMLRHIATAIEATMRDNTPAPDTVALERDHEAMKKLRKDRAQGVEPWLRYSGGVCGWIYNQLGPVVQDPADAILSDPEGSE